MTSSLCDIILLPLHHPPITSSCGDIIIPMMSSSCHYIIDFPPSIFWESRPSLRDISTEPLPSCAQVFPHVPSCAQLCPLPFILVPPASLQLLPPNQTLFFPWIPFFFLLGIDPFGIPSSVGKQSRLSPCLLSSSQIFACQANAVSRDVLLMG